MLKFSFKNIKITPLTYIAFVLCTTGLPLYLSGYFFMKKVQLTQGKFAMVDDEDYERVNRLKWYAYINKKEKKRTWYAVRNSTIRDDSMRMHRFIMNVSIPSVQVDHIDHNGLNNQKFNLRVCTNAQNTRNKPKKSNGIHTSKYKGVHLKKYKSGYITWIAQILSNGVKTHLGCFKTQKKAAEAYNKAAIERFGDFACINKI